VLDRVVNSYGQRDVYLLAPQWIDMTLAPHVRAYYDGLLHEIAARGLVEHVIFHPWIHDDDMPAYFALGAVTLVLGNYVETFGNTPYESLACGTPAVVANVAAYRGMMLPTYTVDYGDTDLAAARVMAYLTNGDEQREATLDWLHTHYQQGDMVRAYERLITAPERLPALEHRYQPPAGWQLAPWCYRTGDGRLYHDFAGETIDQPALSAALDGGTLPADHPLAQQARAAGIVVPSHLQML